MLMYVILGILVSLAVMMHVVSGKKAMILGDKLQSMKPRLAPDCTWADCKSWILDGSLTEFLDMMLDLRKSKSKLWLGYRRTLVEAQAVEILDQIHGIMKSHFFRFLTLTVKEKSQLRDKLLPVVEEYAIDQFDPILKLLNKDDRVKTYLKIIQKEAAKLEDWDAFRKLWQVTPEYSKMEISNMDEPYQYMAIFIYFREKRNSFKRKVFNLIIKLDKQFGNDFRKRIFEVDNYLGLNNKLVDHLKKAFIIGREETETRIIQLEESRRMTQVKEDKEGGSKSPNHSSSAVLNAHVDDVELDLDLPVEMLIEADLETSERALSGSGFSLGFDELPSWQAFVKKYNKTPLDAFGGMIGDSGDTLKKRYRQSMEKLVASGRSTEADTKIAEIQAAWKVVEDLKVHHFLN